MTKSSARKAAAEKARSTYRSRPLAKLAPGKRTVAIARQYPKLSRRERAIHIVRPPLDSRNSLTMRR